MTTSTSQPGASTLGPLSAPRTRRRTAAACCLALALTSACARGGDSETMEEFVRDSIVDGDPYPGVLVGLPSDIESSPYDDVVEALTIVELRSAGYEIDPVDPSDISDAAGRAADQEGDGVPPEIVLSFAVRALPDDALGRLTVPDSIVATMASVDGDTDPAELAFLATLADAGSELAIPDDVADGVLDQVATRGCPDSALVLMPDEVGLLDAATVLRVGDELGIDCSQEAEAYGAEFAAYAAAVAAEVSADSSWETLWAITELDRGGLVDGDAAAASLASIAERPELTEQVALASSRSVQLLLRGLVAADVEIPNGVLRAVEARVGETEAVIVTDPFEFFAAAEALALSADDDARRALAGRTQLGQLSGVERLVVGLAVGEPTDAQIVVDAVRESPEPLGISEFVWIAAERGTDVCPAAPELVTAEAIEAAAVVLSAPGQTNAFELPPVAALIAVADLCQVPGLAGFERDLVPIALAQLDAVEITPLEPALAAEATYALHRTLCITDVDAFDVFGLDPSALPTDIGPEDVRDMHEASAALKLEQMRSESSCP